MIATPYAPPADDLSFLDDTTLTLRQKLLKVLAHGTEFSTAELVDLLDSGHRPPSFRVQVYEKLSEMEDRGQVAGRYDTRLNARGQNRRAVVWRRLPAR